MSGGVWIALSFLLGLLILEMVYPIAIQEGFETAFKPQPLTPAPEVVNTLVAPFIKRTDIDDATEEGGYARDPRFFSGYMDVQRLGEKKDYCRMVFPDGGKEDESFFACALAGTDGLTSVSYRTKSVHDGFKRSRDDYINRIRQDGRDAYCRILKTTDGVYAPMCLTAEDKQFGDSNFLDTNPPDDIKVLVDFYRGCRMWLRFKDDMLDYITGNTILQVAGTPKVSSPKEKPIGIQFNGTDQFIRFGDSSDLSFGNGGSLRSVRAFSVWVKFDEFTNNAHIFDFGNGSGVDNVFLGILGKGDGDSAGNTIRGDSACKDSTVPDGPNSGAQFCPEIRVQDLFKVSTGNINDFDCTGPEVMPDPTKGKPIDTRHKYSDTGLKESATLLYEVWDSKLRKLQIKINRAIPKGEWTHIAITAKNMDALSPTILVYINGEETYSQENGCLPQNAITSKNYLGKSNWTDIAEEYELRDELLRGSIFDFRMYNTALSKNRIKAIHHWGKSKLTPSDSA
jgi:hypothetical protein